MRIMVAEATARSVEITKKIKKDNQRNNLRRFPERKAPDTVSMEITLKRI